MKKAITISVFLMTAAIVNAATETVDGITWTYTVTEDAVSIGGGSASSTAVPTSTSGAITIPSTLGGRPVKRIGEYALYNCDQITNITIPDSVTNISEYAFAYCDGITSVVIPNSVKVVCIGAFAYCNKLKMAMIPQCICALPSSSTGIPSSYLSQPPKTSAGVSCVFGCSSIVQSSYANVSTYPCDPALTNIIVAYGTTYLADSAFVDCKYLQSVTIPATVTRIGSEVFKDCSVLKSVTFEGNAPDVGSNIYEGTPRSLVTYVNGDSIGWAGGISSELPPDWNGRGIAYVGSGGSSGGGGTQTGVDVRYDLSSSQKDRSIASVTVDGDCAIDKFVLTDGKVYDSVIYVNNTADRAVTLSLPDGYEYMVFKDAKPLLIPAKSRHIITITRVADRTFLVSREELEALK